MTSPRHLGGALHVQEDIMVTQTAHPWRATLRTVFQALVAFAAMWAVIVEAAGLDPGLQWVAASLAVTGAITRVMALPQVEQFLTRFVPWLAADPHPQVHAHDVPRFDDGGDPDLRP